ncbi:hypothetical protein FQR65_LT13886 [Abscondita terminalis]|nr:hypothetical protein FQR65_LT13886 [Abscondita terminalis]
MMSLPRVCPPNSTERHQQHARVGIPPPPQRNRCCFNRRNDAVLNFNDQQCHLNFYLYSSSLKDEQEIERLNSVYEIDIIIIGLVYVLSLLLVELCFLTCPKANDDGLFYGLAAVTCTFW